MSDKESTPRAAHDSSDDEKSNAGGSDDNRSNSSDSDNSSVRSNASNKSDKSDKSKSKSDHISDDEDGSPSSARPPRLPNMLSTPLGLPLGGMNDMLKKEPKLTPSMVPPPPPPAAPPGMTPPNGFDASKLGQQNGRDQWNANGANGGAGNAWEGRGGWYDGRGDGSARDQHYQKIKELDEHAAKYKDMPDNLIADMLGTCGSVGSMLHDKGIAQPPPCIFFLRGMCKMGIRCKFQHNAADQQQLQAQGMLMNNAAPVPQWMGGQGSGNGDRFRPAAPPAFQGWQAPNAQGMPPNKRMRPMQNSIPSWLIDEGEVGPSKFQPEWNIPPPLPPGRPGVIN